MARIVIWALDIPPEVEDHVWGHRITPAQLDAILDSRYLVAANRDQRAASHRLIGYNAHGQCICAPIVETHDPHIWRVITAWYCKKSEAALLRRLD